MPEPAVIFEREMLFHLAFLFEFSAANELIEVAWIGERDGRKEIGAYLQRFGEIDALIKTATDKNAAGFNVYVGAAARHPHTAPFGRAKDSDFSAAYALWCDLDSEEAVRAAAEKWRHCPPSMTILTATMPHWRAQCWWRLDKPLRDPACLRKVLAGIAHHLGGDRAVVNPSRIMRLAGLINFPSADKKSRGRIEETARIHELKEPGCPFYPVEEVEAAFPLPERPAAPAHALVGKPAAATAYVAAAIDQELQLIASAPEGQRNCQLNSSGFSLFRLVAEHGVDAAAIAADLLDAALHVGLSEHEARLTIASAARARGVPLRNAGR